MTPTEKQAAKILETINRRTAARRDAGDLEGLRAILAAVDKGRQLAIAALEDLEGATVPETTPEPVKPQPRPAESKLQAVADPTREEIQQAERDTEKARKVYVSRETSDLFEYVISNGGIRPSSEDLAEEYRIVPKSYRRRDGIPGDELADMLSTDMPHLGIREERELLEFFEIRTRQARHARAAA